jgi:hypothetical protein
MIDIPIITSASGTASLLILTSELTKTKTPKSAMNPLFIMAEYDWYFFGFPNTNIAMQ